MTLSQIIARQDKFDKDVPVEGHWTVRIEIQNGIIVYAEKTEKIKDWGDFLKKHRSKEEIKK